MFQTLSLAKITESISQKTEIWNVPFQAWVHLPRFTVVAQVIKFASAKNTTKLLVVDWTIPFQFRLAFIKQEGFWCSSDILQPMKVQ